MINPQRFVLTISLVAIFFVGCADPKAGLPLGSEDMKFDPLLWADEESIAPAEHESGILVSVRERMLGDLVRNVLPGSSKKEIEAKLGASLKTNYFASVDKDLIYYLGPEREGYFGNIDSEWLLIWVRADGVFEKYAIYND